jgi:phosphate/sulfate permease
MRLILLTLISALSVVFMGWMCINVATKDPNPAIFYSLIGAFIVGVFTCRFVLVVNESKMAKYPSSKCEIAVSTLSFWSYASLVTICERGSVCTESMIQQEEEEGSPRVGPSAGASETVVGRVDKKGLTKLLSEVYRYLMIFAACMVCLAHGSNDVANAISPLLVVLGDEGIETSWAYYLGGAGISLGLLILGYKVMETVGKNVIILDFQKGYCCQFATATSIILGTNYGLPLSTTHCMVGSLAGIVIASKLSVVKRAYNIDDQSPATVTEVYASGYDDVAATQSEKNATSGETADKVAPVKDENSAFNKKTVYKILFFWALTVPVATIVSYSVTALLLINAA